VNTGRLAGPTPPTPPTPSYRWVVLGIATFTQATSCFFVQGIGALSLVFRHTLGLSTVQLGLLLSASQLVPLIGLFIAGELLDRYGERWVVGAGGYVVSAGLGLGCLASGYPTLLIALLIVGAGYSTAQPGGSKSVAGWFSPAQRGLAMGIRQAGLPLGGALAAAVLPALAQDLGWRAAFAVGGLVAFVGASVFTGLYRQPPDAAASPPSHPQAGESRPGPISAITDRLRSLREPAMIRLLISGTCLVSVHSGITLLAVLYLHTKSAVGAGSAALTLVGIQAAGGLGRITLAAWSDHHPSGRYRTVTASMVAVAVGMAVLMTPAGRTPWIAITDFLWLGFFGIGWYGPWVAHLTESAPPGRTGFTLGSVMAVNQIAVIIAPPALGLLSDLSHSFTPAWGTLSGMTALALAITARHRPSRPGSATGAGRHHRRSAARLHPQRSRTW